MNPGAIARAGTLVVAGLLVVSLRLAGEHSSVGSSRRGRDAGACGHLGDPARIHSGCRSALTLSSASPSAVPSYPIRRCRGVRSPRPSSGCGCSRRRRARYGFLAPVPGNVQVRVLRWRPGLGRLGGRRRGCDRSWWSGRSCARRARISAPGPWARPQPSSFRSSWRGSWLLGSQARQSCRRGSLRRSETTSATGDVVFSDPETAYALAAYAPVYINDSEPGHVADTVENPASRAQARYAPILADAGISRRLGATCDSRPLAGATGCSSTRIAPRPRTSLQASGPSMRTSRFALYDLRS